MVMKKPNYEVMQSFSLKNIPDLDICVLGALEFFSGQKLPKININRKKTILVLGSGNALDTGRMIFSDYHAHFESESTYKQKLKNLKFSLAVLISASGEKHAPKIAKHLKSKKIKTILFTNNSKAPAAKFASETLVFPKQREPYTYNTSTYISMILGQTHEDPKKIYRHIKKIDKLIPKDLSKYEAFYFIVPSKFDSIRSMFVTKFDELFGPKITGRVFTKEQTKHAKTVISSDKELFVSFGKKNINYGTKRLNIPLPKNTDYGTIMTIGYYLIGKIQKQDPAFFKRNIVKYTDKASKIFKQKINPIVE